MKDNTRIRLRLSKHLFESLATQVLAESKKDAISGGAYTEAVKQPKAKGEKSDSSAPKPKKAEAPAKSEPKKLAPKPKKAVPMKEEGGEDMVTITLDEIMQAGSAEYEVGKWVADNWPAVADALKSASQDPQQAIADLGGQVISLATVGTVAISAGLAVAKDSIVAAAKKLKSKLAGSKSAVAEGEDDSKLDQIVAMISADKKQMKKA